jgi:hypothetical protein
MLGQLRQFCCPKRSDEPPKVAKAFLADMHAFFTEKNNKVKADGIAARQLHALKPTLLGKAQTDRRDRDVPANEG